MSGLIARVGGGLPSAYWKLWLASAGSNLADGMFWIALPLLAVRLTDSPGLVAGVVVASRLPWLLFALVAGALADRFDRRRTMVLVNLFRGGVLGALALAAFADLATLPLLYVVAFVLGVAETLFDTSAQSIMPSLVEPDRLSRANGRLYAVELTMNQFVGPPVGGFLAALAIGLAFGAGAAAYLLAATSLFTIAGSFRPVREGPPTRMHHEIAEGLRYLFGHSLLRVLAVMVGISNLASAAAFSVFVLYAVSPGPIGLDEVGFGLLMTGLAIGNVVGSFFVERLERRLGRANLLAISMTGFSATILAPALTTSAPAIAAIWIVGGVIGISWNVVTVSLRQRIVPDRLLGRVNASYRLLAWGTLPVGAALGGLAGEVFGVRSVFLIFGGLGLLLLLGRLVITDPAIEAAELAAEAAATPSGDDRPGQSSGQ
ncbi:MAG TPA: MFS transporter [Candidatus Limnocylindrales bacterium]|nr:MFS transporter [Candidatus Limnocylindrales bacterium]